MNALPEKLVVWGGRSGNLDSFRHINRAYAAAASKLGVKVSWVDDAEKSRNAVTPGSTVWSVDIWNEHLPYVRDVNYVLHNFSGDHPVAAATLENQPERLLRVQVWSHDAFGDKWDRYRWYSPEHQILFQPWGTDLLAEEFMEPVFNPQSHDVVFIGAIWDDHGLGNQDAINHLREACSAVGLVFKHYTQIPDEQMTQLIREARLAPTTVGRWQCEHGYLPCRAFKVSSYGQLMFTNSFEVATLFDGPWVGDSIAQGLDAALRLNQRTFEQRVLEQQRFASAYTYRESLQAIQRAFDHQQS